MMWKPNPEHSTIRRDFEAARKGYRFDRMRRAYVKIHAGTRGHGWPPENLTDFGNRPEHRRNGGVGK